MTADGCETALLLSFFTLSYSPRDNQVHLLSHSERKLRVLGHRPCGADIPTSSSGLVSPQTGAVSPPVTHSPPLLPPTPPHPCLLPVSLGFTPLGPHMGGSRRTDLFTWAFSLSTMPAGLILVGTRTRVSFQEDSKRSLINLPDGETGFPLGRVVKNPPAVAETQEMKV